MDFITSLPLTRAGYNAIMTCVDRLSKLTILIPCVMGDSALSAGEVAQLFFTHVVRRFGQPGKLFMMEIAGSLSTFGGTCGLFLEPVFTSPLPSIRSQTARPKGCTGLLSMCSMLS